MNRLTIAVPKGRLQGPTLDLFARVGLRAQVAEASRALVVPTADDRARVLFAKPMDVPTFVEYGAADIGVVGSDVLAETEHDVLQPLDLRFGACRLVLAGPCENATAPLPPHAVHRVATKYPATTARYFARRSLQAETIRLVGSVELAPRAGLASLIVDLVQTGATLRENGLTVLDEIAETSARLIVNRAAQKLRFAEIDALIRALSEEVTP